MLNQSTYSVSTDRQHRIDGQSRVWDERRNAYVTDAAGEAIAFPTPYDAQQWIERQWAAKNGIRL